MGIEIKDKPNLAHELWVYSCQLEGLGRLIAHQNPLDGVLLSEGAAQGIASLLMGISERLHALYIDADEQEVSRARKRGKDE